VRTDKKNISRKGPRNCRSLGFARDDKKERVVVKRGRLPKEKAVAGGKAFRPTSGPPLTNTLSL
jgi:hypothetical protein